MTTIIVAALISFLSAVIMTRLVIVISRRLDILDRPDGYRKVHLSAVPRLGGLAVFVAFCTPLVALMLMPGLSMVSRNLLEVQPRTWGLLLGAGLTVALGLADDILDLPAGRKLAGQIIIASIVYFFGFSIGAVSNPFGSPLQLGIFSFPITIFWFVGCMNAVNLLDGLDGLAAGMTLFVSVTLFLVSLHFGNFLGMLLMAALSGAVLGFLLYNFPPARIFLGDSGSMLLGFLIAGISLIGASRKAEAAVALFVPIVALGLPILDTTIAIVRRWYRKLPVSTPDREHIHHMLVAMGYSQQRAVLFLYLVCVLLGAAALVVTFARSEVVLVMVAALAVIAFVVIRIFSGVQFRDVLTRLSEDKLRHQEAVAARVAVEKAAYLMQHAPDLESLWKMCFPVFESLKLDYAKLVVYGATADGLEALVWEGESGAREGGGCDGWSARLSLRCGKPVLGELVIGREVSGELILPETYELLDRLRAALAFQVVRIAGESSPTSTEGGDEKKEDE